MNLNDYIDDCGLLTPDGKGSGNGVRYTCDWILGNYLLYKMGKIPISSSFDPFLAALNKCEDTPGLLMRTPDNAFGYQSIDDTIARITVDYILMKERTPMWGGFVLRSFAERFLEYGRTQTPERADLTDDNYKVIERNVILYAILSRVWPSALFYTYNNLHPRHFALQSWIGRQQAIIAHAQWVAGEKVPFWRRLIWCVSILNVTFKKHTHQDEWVLGFHLVVVGGKRGWLNKCVAARFRSALKKRWPNGGLGECLEDYFTKPHPLSELFWDVYG